jgi:hypothetical protein
MLRWEHHKTLPIYIAKSPSAKHGDFRIFYDDTMYWCNFADISPTQDIKTLKKVAQDLHDSFKFP